ncbi:MAG: hypothetical protein HC822_08040 [Oscillochloris sp.]|nr:hypothetical protein [Oscillochloris sp.]
MVDQQYDSQPPMPAPGLSVPPQRDRSPSRRDIFGRTVRLLLRRLLYLFVHVGAIVRPRIGWVLLVLFLLGVIGLQSALMVVPRLMAAFATDTRAALLVPSASVEQFLEGQSSFNADLMWDSFSPAFQTVLQERGGSREALAAQIESERLAGQRYGAIAYVGGVTIDSEHRRFFYTINVESPTPERNGLFSFIFTVDSDGKILSVKMDS